MDRSDLVLAALAAGGAGAQYPPAQVQKLFFLIDKEIPEEIDGAQFNFAPYDFGPFDASVYHEIEGLQATGLTTVSYGGRYRSYGLTDAGYRAGMAILASMSPRAKAFVERAAKWVRSVSFEHLVSAIYQRYPDMKARSIFRGS